MLNAVVRRRESCNTHLSRTVLNAPPYLQCSFYLEHFHAERDQSPRRLRGLSCLDHFIGKATCLWR
jgi:hypothetical protein